MNEDHVYPRELQSAWNRFVAAGISRLPSPLQRLVKRIWPRYGLPDCVILKKLRKPEHTEAFENEQVMCRRLAAAQGSLIPYYYGEADCEGDRTNAISFLPWPTVRDQPLPYLTLDEFQRRMEVAMDELVRYGGVVHDDPKLNNIMIADDGRFVFIDLESVYEQRPETAASDRKWAVHGFVHWCKHYLKVKRQEAEEMAQSARIQIRSVRTSNLN